MPKKYIRDARRAARAAQDGLPLASAGGGGESSSLASASSEEIAGTNSITSTVEVAAGTSFEVPISGYENCTLVWSFSTEKSGGDIGFGVAFAPDPPSPVNYGPNSEYEDEEEDAAANGKPSAKSVASSASSSTTTTSGNSKTPDPEEIVLLETTRCDSDKREIHGTMSIAKPGTVYLRFDNGFSYLRPKTLTYTVELEEPLGGQFGPHPLGGPQVPKVVFVLGGPGAGKGTQCTRLATEHGFLHVSAGDLLRAERNDPKSKHGAMITQYIKEGKIVPVEITVSLLWRAIRASARKYILVDGFPRNKDNVDGWNRKVGARAEVACVLDFQVPDAVLVSRLLERGKASGRDDDNEESIKKRLATFHGETKPILEHFQAQGKVIAIDGNRDREVVYADLTKALTRALELPKLPSPEEYVLAAPKNRKPLNVVLGTMNMGGPSGLGDADTREIVKEFLSSPPVNSAGATPAVELDTARMYAGGETEKVLGRVLPSLLKSLAATATANNPLPRLKIATKANPFPSFGNSLSPESVAQQLGDSLGALKHTSVDIFYLHAPDPSTPLEATLEACDALHRLGKFQELGLSNFPSWLVVHCYHICSSRGWVRPTVYQGMYNALTREVEKELIPALRYLNIRFYAYNPLAGGLLTSGRYLENGDDIPEKGRFGTESRNGSMYRDRYWKASYFAALADVDAVCRQFNVTIQDAAMRWLSHHSALRASKNDAVIVGGSTVQHLRSNVASARYGGPLPLPVVIALENAWTDVKGDCPKYFRP